ncbi:type II secretion system F family protein [Chromatiaceae bacterium AAb-1]|nr:type II secretion system F family protein [Chromatiaceae bacterium AAb-1]
MYLRRQGIKAATIYDYLGRHDNGETIRGELTGRNTADIKIQLRQQSVTAVWVKRRRFWQYWLEKRITPADITALSRQLTTMLQAGVPLLQTLILLSHNHTKIRLKRLLQQIAARIQAGWPLADTLAAHPDCFSSLYCNLVRAGEQSGLLDQIFDRITLYRESSEALQRKIRKALLYPVAVTVIALAVTGILLLYVVPQFTQLFSEMGAELPVLTRWVLMLSELLQQYAVHLFATLVLLILLFRTLYRKLSRVQYGADMILLHLPLAGAVIRKATLARCCRVLGTSFAAGVPLPDALLSAAAACNNILYSKAVLQLRYQVMAGQPLATEMQKNTLFPPVVIQFIAIGETSGTLGTMLHKIAVMYEQETDDAVTGLTSLLEPVIMSVIGLITGILVIALYLPIFRLGSVIG